MQLQVQIHNGNGDYNRMNERDGYGDCAAVDDEGDDALSSNDLVATWMMPSLVPS
jgi:hypothetical protein